MSTMGTCAGRSSLPSRGASEKTICIQSRSVFSEPKDMQGQPPTHITQNVVPAGDLLPSLPSGMLALAAASAPLVQERRAVQGNRQEWGSRTEGLQVALGSLLSGCCSTWALPAC